MEDKGVISTLDFEAQQELVWLVKVPQYIADPWMQAEYGTELGTVSLINKGANVSPEVEMTLRPQALKIKEADKVPLDFNCKYSNQIANEIKIFSENVEGRIGLEGLVHIKVDCAAKDPMLLGKLINARATQTRKLETHDLKVFEEQEVDTYASKQASIKNKLTGIEEKDKRKKGEKRERLPKHQLESLIFEAFYSSPMLTLAQLDKMVQQPVSYLKEVLSEMCVYHQSGKSRLHYELKDEFKSKKQRLESQAVANVTSNGPTSS